MYEVESPRKRSPFEVFIIVVGGIGNLIFASIEALVMAIAFCVVLYLFILTPHEVVGRSMYPTYENGEFLLANKVIYKISEPKRGDVIIFKHSETLDYIKRIIAVPGDNVSLLDGKIYVNNVAIDESDYLASSIYTDGGATLAEGETITVPENQYFVCGDNRPHSSDSREFGPIDKSTIKGKVWVVYYPFSNFRFIKDPSYK